MQFGCSQSHKLKQNPPSATKSALCLWLATLLCAGISTQTLSAGDLLSTTNSKPVATARVVVVNNPQATTAYKVRPEIVHAMIDQGITALTGSNNVAAAWSSLVTPQDTVGIKIYSTPGPTCGTRPAVVAAVIEGLLAAHVPSQHIVIWDRRLEDLQRAGFATLAARYDVRLAGSAEAGWDEKTFYETALVGNLLWSDMEFGSKAEGAGRKSYVTRLLSHELTKIINIAPLLNHNTAGAVGQLYNLAFGSVDNTQRFDDAPSRIATAVPEIYALPALGDRVVLNISDALLCQYAGMDRGLLHYSTMINELRFSRDPVALDVLALTELERQRARAGFPDEHINPELIQNAALLELGIGDPKKIQVDNVR